MSEMRTPGALLGRTLCAEVFVSLCLFFLVFYLNILRVVDLNTKLRGDSFVPISDCGHSTKELKKLPLHSKAQTEEDSDGMTALQQKPSVSLTQK